MQLTCCVIRPARDGLRANAESFATLAPTKKKLLEQERLRRASCVVIDITDLLQVAIGTLAEDLHVSPSTFQRLCMSPRHSSLKTFVAQDAPETEFARDCLLAISVNGHAHTNVQVCLKQARKPSLKVVRASLRIQKRERGCTFSLSAKKKAALIVSIQNVATVNLGVLPVVGP